MRCFVAIAKRKSFIKFFMIIFQTVNSNDLLIKYLFIYLKEYSNYCKCFNQCSMSACLSTQHFWDLILRLMWWITYTLFGGVDRFFFYQGRSQRGVRGGTCPWWSGKKYFLQRVTKEFSVLPCNNTVLFVVIIMDGNYVLCPSSATSLVLHHRNGWTIKLVEHCCLGKMRFYPKYTAQIPQLSSDKEVMVWTTELTRSSYMDQMVLESNVRLSVQLKTDSDWLPWGKI